MKPKAVVLLSGGMDSTTALMQALADGAKEVYPLSFRYGSLHQEPESKAADQVVRWVQAKGLPVAPRQVLTLPSTVFQGAGSSLMGEAEMPHMTYKEIAESGGPSPTVVPFRNGVFLSLAAAFAVTKEADFIYAGMHAEDARNFAYPDCTPEFLGAMANAIYVGTYQKVRLVFPYIWMTKGDIVTRAALVEAPLHLTWSCYEGGESHCGKCPTCVERIQAFKDAGYVDPVVYANGSVTWRDEELWPTR